MEDERSFLAVVDRFLQWHHYPEQLSHPPSTGLDLPAGALGADLANFEGRHLALVTHVDNDLLEGVLVPPHIDLGDWLVVAQVNRLLEQHLVLVDILHVVELKGLSTINLVQNRDPPRVIAITIQINIHDFYIWDGAGVVPLVVSLHLLVMVLGIHVLVDDLLENFLLIKLPDHCAHDLRFLVDLKLLLVLVRTPHEVVTFRIDTFKYPNGSIEDFKIWKYHHSYIITAYLWKYTPTLHGQYLILILATLTAIVLEQIRNVELCFLVFHVLHVFFFIV